MTNRLVLPNVRLGIYPPRKSQPQHGRVIEIEMPSILPQPEHTPTPPLFIYGSLYKLVLHSGEKEGDAFLSLCPAFKEDGGRHMQKMGSRIDPEAWPKTTKIEFQEIYNSDMPNLFARLQSFMALKFFDPLDDLFPPKVYGRKFVFEALAHPVTGRITLYFPSEMETNDSQSEVLE